MNRDLAKALVFTANHLSCWEALTQAILTNLSRCPLKDSDLYEKLFIQYPTTVEGIATIYRDHMCGAVEEVVEAVVMDFFKQYQALYGVMIYNSPEQSHMLASFYHSLTKHHYTTAAEKLITGMIEDPRRYPIPGILNPFLSALAKLPRQDAYPGLAPLYRHILSFYRAGADVSRSIYHTTLVPTGEIRVSWWLIYYYRD